MIASIDTNTWTRFPHTLRTLLYCDIYYHYTYSYHKNNQMFGSYPTFIDYKYICLI